MFILKQHSAAHFIMHATQTLSKGKFASCVCGMGFQVGAKQLQSLPGLRQKIQGKARTFLPVLLTGYCCLCCLAMFCLVELIRVGVYVYSTVVQLNSVIWQLSLQAKSLWYFSFCNLAVSAIHLTTAWKTDSLYIFPVERVARFAGGKMHHEIRCF